MHGSPSECRILTQPFGMQHPYLGPYDANWHQDRRGLNRIRTPALVTKAGYRARGAFSSIAPGEGSFAIAESSYPYQMDTSDLYKILQVDPSAELDVIRAAYRVLAAKHHPDVGGSAQRMTQLNSAWNVLSDRTKRAAFDRERRVRVSGDRWDAHAAPSRSGERAIGTILDFGRYAGWSIPELAQTDPEFLEWLGRTPIGRRYRTEIDEVLSATRQPARVATERRPRNRQRRR
jgi:hypothetical protein